MLQSVSDAEVRRHFLQSRAELAVQFEEQGDPRDATDFDDLDPADGAIIAELFDAWRKDREDFVQGSA